MPIFLFEKWGVILLIKFSTCVAIMFEDLLLQAWKFSHWSFDSLRSSSSNNTRPPDTRAYPGSAMNTVKTFLWALFSPLFPCKGFGKEFRIHKVSFEDGGEVATIFSWNMKQTGLGFLFELEIKKFLPSRRILGSIFYPNFVGRRIFFL